MRSDALGLKITEIGTLKRACPMRGLRRARPQHLVSGLFATHIRDLPTSTAATHRPAGIASRCRRPDLRNDATPHSPGCRVGASDFPLAFSTAVPDTAAAAAAGSCPVVVKGHGAHPYRRNVGSHRCGDCQTWHGTRHLQLRPSAVAACGETLVTDPRIKAVALPRLGGGCARCLTFAPKRPERSRSLASWAVSIRVSYCRKLAAARGPTLRRPAGPAKPDHGREANSATNPASHRGIRPEVGCLRERCQRRSETVAAKPLLTDACDVTVTARDRVSEGLA